MEQKSASQTVEEPLDLIRLSLDERIYVKYTLHTPYYTFSTTQRHAAPALCSCLCPISLKCPRTGAEGASRSVASCTPMTST